MPQTNVVQVTRKGKFIQNGIRYLKAFLLNVLLKNVYQGVHTKGIRVTLTPFCANRLDTHS